MQNGIVTLENATIINEKNVIFSSINFKVNTGEFIFLIGKTGTGKSSLLAVDALREAKVNVKGMVAIFTYGFDIAQTNFENKNVVLNTLSDYNNLLLKAESTKYISSSEAALLSQWRNDPSTWDPKSST